MLDKATWVIQIIWSLFIGSDKWRAIYILAAIKIGKSRPVLSIVSIEKVPATTIGSSAASNPLILMLTFTVIVHRNLLMLLTVQ